MATPTYEFSGVVYTATADQTTFALTTDTGRSIGYLKFEHIHVRVSTDDGENWVNLVYTDDWVFADPTTSIVLNTPVAAGTLVDIHRTTPMEDDYIDFQKGSLLTAAQLNEFDTWQLYVDQELNDKTLSLEGDLSSLAVTQIIAGDNITINPEDGKGPVTINAADPPVTRIIAGEYVDLNPASGLGDVTINVLPPPGGLTYKGTIDATGPAPADPQDGDLYINTAEGGVVGSSWTGIAGAELVGAERLIYGGDTAPDQWSLLENPGVPEAPSDGETYARSDEEWVAIESFPEAPQDGDIYGRSDADWVAIEGFPEAPQDGDIYGRSDADWVAIEGFPEAPQDGEVYGRSDGGWVVIPPGTVVSETAPADPAEGQQWWADSDVQDGGGRLYIYTGEEWVDTSLPGVGADFDETKAEELFLKLDASNDPVTGNCEFTAGVNVTGGNVGIGTDSPGAKFSVSENSRSINLGVPVEGYATIHQQGSSNTALEVGGWGDVVIAADTNSVASKNIIFSKQGTQGSYSETMRIDSSGNVGIAKEDPEYKLDINSNHARIGNGTSVGIIQYGSNSNATSNFHLGAASGVFRLWNGDIGSGTEILRINSTGGVSWDDGANFLDDYEEGEFVPHTQTLQQPTTPDSIKYTKIGNKITCWIWLRLNGFTASNTSWVHIKGLPYPILDQDIASGSGYIGSAAGFNTYPTSGFGLRNTDEFYLRKEQTAFTWSDMVNASNKCDLHCIFQYFV